ncbi:MAG: hypothetical protein GQ562_09510 [Anaerolineales bacterium]|nr:hypothetical protein [Anaerolineales bacterium]
MGENVNVKRLLAKTLILFALLAFGLIPLIKDNLGKASLYNLIIPGRYRFPYGENPDQSFNISLFNLEANFASHVVSDQPESSNEFRVFLIGDSSVWGTLLKPEETLAGQLNSLEMHIPDGTPIRFYNLGYPTLSLAKDLLLLEESLEYKPDLIIWFLTLESFPDDKQLTSPLVSHNYKKFSLLISNYDIDLNPDDEVFSETTYWNQTLIGQRRNLADIFRLQFYGVMWGITGIDQHYPEDYETAKRNFEEDTTFHDWDKGEIVPDDLAYHLLNSGQKIAGKTPILLVNEPILISSGTNSDLRYNYYYPIWAYEQYRQNMQELSKDNGWYYQDFWNLIAEEEFTNTAIHLTPKGVGILSEKLSEMIMEHIRNQPLH